MGKGVLPMIITRTPFRVSLFGGGTDYSEYWSEHGGDVLGFAIDRYCYLSIRKLPPFFEYKHRFSWSNIELVKTYDEIEHPAAKAILKLYGPDYGIELRHDADLPAKSGLGSSSSFTVGLLNALYALRGDQTQKNLLAKEAIFIEQKVLKENVGCQDQIWAACGGFNRIEFFTDGRFECSPVILSESRKAELNGSLMLFFTGFSRYASEIAGKQIANFPNRLSHLKRMRQMVGEVLAILQSQNGSLDDIGYLLHEGWRLKRELASEVSTDLIDTIYAAGRSAGALGGKLLGAGGGGFLLFYVPEGAKKAVKERLKDLINVTFKIGAEGSRVVLYEPNGL